MKTPIVFVDLETGGLSPQHPDIQVAAVVVEGWEEREVFEAKIRFDVARCDAEVLAMNSYDPEAWERTAKSEAQVVGELGSLLRCYAAVPMISARGKPYRVARIAGHNVVGFDVPRLRAMFARHNAFLPAAIFQPLDTLQLALWTCATSGQAPASYKLGDLCRHFGVALADAHDALADVRATVALARRLVESR